MSAPAGWLADPSGRHQLRYWDGSSWTEHVSNAGAQAVDPLAANPPAPGEPAAAAGGSWMDKAKTFAQQAADQASSAVDSASDAIDRQTTQWQAQPPTSPQAAQPYQRPTAPAAGPVPDVADQIRRLAQLRDEGILTEEEFAAKKTKLLSQ